MTLRARLTLAFAVVSLSSLVGLAAASWWAVSTPFERSADRELQAMVSAVQADLARGSGELTERLDQLANELSRTSAARPGADLLAAAADGHSGALFELKQWLEERANASGVDLLKVVRDDGTVLAAYPYQATALSPHFADYSAVQLAQANAAPTARYEKIVDPSGEQVEKKVPALLGTRSIANGRAVLVAGTFLDQAYVDRVSRLVRGTAVLLGAHEALQEPKDSDRTLVRTLPQPLQEYARIGFKSGTYRQGADYRFEPIELNPAEAGAPGADSLWLVVGISESGLVAARRAITLAFVALGLFFGLASFLAGTALSRRFSSPIEELEKGAAAIAGGDLDYRVPAVAEGEVGHLVDAFNQMAEDLKQNREQLARSERVAAWREMARMIAHEIKNPLTPIQLAVQTTQRARREGHEDFDEIFEESAGAILEEVNRLRSLVQEFSEFARMPPPNLGSEDLNEVVRGALGLFTGLPGSVKLETELGEKLPPVHIDPDQISRAVLNLVSNAAEAIEEDGGSGRIVVRTTGSSDALEGVALQITDDGPGMDEQTRQNLFTPYFTTKSNGTGLGMAIVHRIVTDHGGKIDVESQPGSGTTICVYLPRHSEGSG